MELSLEEAFDVIIELLGCGIIVLLMQLFIHNNAIITMLERMI